MTEGILIFFLVDLLKSHFHKVLPAEPKMNRIYEKITKFLLIQQNYRKKNIITNGVSGVCDNGVVTTGNNTNGNRSLS